MLTTFVFEFPNGLVYCAGESDAVKRIHSYFCTQDKVYGRNIDMGKFIDRIIMNGVYAYLEPSTMKDYIIERFIGYNRCLAVQELLLTEDEYLEATVLAFPEICCRELELTSVEFETIKRESIWNKRIDME